MFCNHDTKKKTTTFHMKLQSLMVNKNHGRRHKQQVAPFIICPILPYENETFLPITSWNTKHIDTVPVNEQRRMAPNATSLFKLKILPPILDGSGEMEQIKMAQERDILQTMRNRCSTSNLRMILHDYQQTTRMGLFFCTTDKRFVDMSHHVAKQIMVAIISMHPTF